MKKIIASSILSVIVLGFAVPSVQAATVDIDSKGKVKFSNEEGGDQPTPVDPSEKNPNPIVVDEDHPGTEGYLRFDRVPQFDFGTVELKSTKVDAAVLQDNFKTVNGDEIFYAAPTVQVTDKRGSNAGWTTTVTAGAFELVDKDDATEIESGKSLKAARISIAKTNVNVHTTDGSITMDYAPDVIAREMVLEAEENGNVEVFASAKAGSGMGQWSISFTDTDLQGEEDANPTYPNKHTTQGTEESIRLTVPESSQKLVGRDYRSNITWTMSDEPSAL